MTVHQTNQIRLNILKHINLSFSSFQLRLKYLTSIWIHIKIISADVKMTEKTVCPPEDHPLFRYYPPHSARYCLSNKPYGRAVSLPNTNTDFKQFKLQTDNWCSVSFTCKISKCLLWILQGIWPSFCKCLLLSVAVCFVFVNSSDSFPPFSAGVTWHNTIWPNSCPVVYTWRVCCH